MTEQLKQERINQIVIDAIEREIIKENLEQGIPEEVTRQQLAEDKKLMDCYDYLLIEGYTEAQIDALWEGKTNQEILTMPSVKDYTPNSTKA